MKKMLLTLTLLSSISTKVIISMESEELPKGEVVSNQLNKSEDNTPINQPIATSHEIPSLSEEQPKENPHQVNKEQVTEQKDKKKKKKKHNLLTKFLALFSASKENKESKK